LGGGLLRRHFLDVNVAPAHLFSDLFLFADLMHLQGNETCGVHGVRQVGCGRAVYPRLDGVAERLDAILVPRIPTKGLARCFIFIAVQVVESTAARFVIDAT
jgi:hypothetical protein